MTGSTGTSVAAGATWAIQPLAAEEAAHADAALCPAVTLDADAAALILGHQHDHTHRQQQHVGRVQQVVVETAVLAGELAGGFVQHLIHPRPAQVALRQIEAHL